MKIKFLFALLFGSLISAYAQNPGSITGKVVDSKTKESLPYVSIVVKNGDQVVTGGITEDNGLFTIKNLELKKYTVEVQFMGYTTHKENITLGEAARFIDMGIIQLTESNTVLEEVEIVKEVSTIEQKLDRKVITVGRDLTTAGGTAAEIMNNIPSVNVDQDGNISLRGNQNVRVLLDGRPTNISPAQLLKQIPSTSIKKIELITNPSAKYNPEGMSGIINIILNKNTNDGFNGNLSSGITFGKVPKFNNSLDMNYRMGKVNFFATTGSNFGKNYNWGKVERNTPDVNSLQDIDVVNDNENYFGKFGLDFYLDDKNTISAYVNLNNFSADTNINIGIDYAGSDSEDTTQESVFDSGNHNNTYNLAYKHKFDKDGHTLDFEGNLNETKGSQAGIYDIVTGNVPSNYIDRVEDNRTNTTLNLDYVNPLSEKSTLELGAESRIIRSDNDYNTTNPLITNPVSDYTYDMDIYSAYATFGQKFEKIGYQVGARFESYKVKAKSNSGGVAFDDDYITVYPSAYLTYNLNQKNMFQVSYTRRVDRPSLEQTKPIREFSTPLITSLGNPELEPQFTNSVELNYTKVFEKGSSITAGIFYRLINDEISRVLYPDETTENPNDQIMTFDNYNNNKSYGFEVSANYKIAKWMDIQPAIDFSSISQKGAVSQSQPDGTYEFVIRQIDANAFNARLNANFRVNKRLSFILFGFYRGPVNGVQNNSKEMYKVDSGVSYNLLDNQLTFNLRFNDMFKTMRYAFDSQYPFPQSGEFRWESHTAYFSLNYRFGGGKNRAMQRKYRDNNTKQSGGGMF
ncbi:TonB-dependent receptor [Flavobacterium alkalisoli]|uniref:TonB-dependent receptor n=1 Tax=Flavobacterium alkalisoli TaxID=2602769 RepID=A0A5B9FRB3_9FLAO|nr:outer membrane beta-barrel family protein [Flavobacterium alkalisoli]QEE49510.1 TonB-dependent receptor [Flavobacterium alkalisoli]